MFRSLRSLAAGVALVVGIGLPGPVGADEANGAASVDSVAKRRADQFDELQKKNGSEAANQRLEILRGLAFVLAAPVVRAAGRGDALR